MNYKIGDVIQFGNYWHNANGIDKPPIEWIILELKNQTALLISKYGIDTKPYNNDWGDATWETCTLRKWLNDEFYNTAFSTEEQQRIMLSRISADENPKYSTDPGNATQDNVFLLSITESEKYFANDKARSCAPTEYAIKNGAFALDSYKTAEDCRAGWWWLRSPGDNSDYGACVSPNGFVNHSGDIVDYNYYGIRPVIRIKL